jgi:hypothetical protein
MNRSCSMGALHGWFQVEVLGEGGKQEVSFVSVEIEKRYFGLVVAQHGLHVLVVEIIVDTIHQIRIVDFNSGTHKLYILY